MRRIIALTASAVLATVTLGGCESMDDQQRRTATGAGVGAAAGAAIGAIGNDSNRGRGAAAGAAIGAAAGALGGYVWNKRMESQQKQIQQATQGTGVEVNRTADNRLQIIVPGDIAFDSGRPLSGPTSGHRSIILRSRYSRTQAAPSASSATPTQQAHRSQRTAVAATRRRDARLPRFSRGSRESFQNRWPRRS